MRIALHDSERETLKHKTFPNYALMKISAYHKARGDTVEWFVPSEKYDKVYSSKVFDFTPENPYLPPDTIKGGTGYDVHSKLPDDIENCYPDYSIYPECDYAIGYITRGCPNHCRWCVVPEKEGGIHPYRTWQQLVRPDTDKLVLMDNNILACKYGVEQLESLIGSGYRIDLNQGMDARLVNDNIARILSQLQWIRYIRFSCDSTPQIEAIFRAAEALQGYGVKPYRLFVYLLVTDDLENAAHRVDELKKLKGINIYAQAERNIRQGIVPNKLQLEFAQRYVYSGKYRGETWREYCERKNFLPPNGNDKEERTMVWDGATLAEEVKENLYDLFSGDIKLASRMSNKEFADLLKSKHNNSGMSTPSRKSYISTRSKGIEIRFTEPVSKELGKENTLELSWSTAARHIRSWELEREETADNNAAKNSKEDKPMIKPAVPIGGFNFSTFASQNNQLKIMPIDMLVPYRNHKFKMYEGERLDDMVQSVKANGVLTPIIVRAIDGGEKYEILAGHNRTNAARIAGLTNIPAVVKENLSDEEAEMYVVETNVMQRGFDDLSVTERAAVVAARHSAMFDEDKRRAIERELAMLNGEEIEEQEESVAEKKSKLAAVGENYGLSKDSVARLVRVDKLADELKPYVDSGEIAVRAAVNLSYLSQNEQNLVAELMDLGMDMRKAALLREVSKQGKLTEKAVRDIMYRGELIDKDAPFKRKPIKVKISADISEKYFAPDWDEKKVQEIVGLALERYFANGEFGEGR